MSEDETNKKKPTWALSYVTASGVSEEGHIRVQKFYSDGREEQITFDDMHELELLLMEMSDQLPTTPCPKCGMAMPPWFVKEYTCERCDKTYSENYLEYYDEIEGAKVEMEKRAQAEANKNEHA